jgi:hypothetical protein
LQSTSKIVVDSTHTLLSSTLSEVERKELAETTSAAT